MTSTNDLIANEEEFHKLAKSMGVNLAAGSGLGMALRLIVGSGAGIVGTAIGILQSGKDLARKMAESAIRKEYKDNQITILGQQISSTLTSKECCAFVQKVGGVVWVQDVPITLDSALSRAVFWHPSHTFTLAKNITQVYRSTGSQCT